MLVLENAEELQLHARSMVLVIWQEVMPLGQRLGIECDIRFFINFMIIKHVLMIIICVLVVGAVHQLSLIHIYWDITKRCYDKDDFNSKKHCHESHVLCFFRSHFFLLLSLFLDVMFIMSVSPYLPIFLKMCIRDSIRI